MPSTEPEEKQWQRDERRVWAVALFTGTMLNFACRNCMPLSAVEISQELDLDKREIGLILSCFYWGYASTQIFSGWLSDRVGGDHVLSIATLGWGSLTVVFPYLVHVFDTKSSQIKFLVFMRVLFAALQAFHYPALASLLAKRIQEKNGKSRIYTTIMSGTSAGNVLSGSVGSLLLSRYGWPCVFYTFGTLSVLWALFVRYFMIQEISNVSKSVEKLHNGTGSHKVDINKVSKGEVPWRILCTHSAFWAMILSRFCLNYVFNLIFSWLPTYFTEKFPDEKGYVFNVIPWLLCVPSSILSGFIADQIMSAGYSVTLARKVLHTAECVGVIMCLLSLSSVTSYSGSVALATLTLVFQSLGGAGLFSNPQDLAPNYAGTVFGLMNTAGAIPGFIGVYVAGHMLEYFHSWSAVFESTAAASFTGLMIFIVFGSGKKII
ncbi:voltage-gated purine nucleotide uniporter SLC17A9-like [Glandiceps talaboti]